MRGSLGVTVPLEEGVVTSFDTSGDKRKNGGGDNNKVNHRANNDSGGRGGTSNRGDNDGGGRGNNDDSNHTTTRGGYEGGNRGGINGGSIINASGEQMKLPATLSKQYCGHFMKTELSCNFGQSCKKEHASFPAGFSDGDVTKMIFSWSQQGSCVSHLRFSFRRLTVSLNRNRK